MNVVFFGRNGHIGQILLFFGDWYGLGRENNFWYTDREEIILHLGCDFGVFKIFWKDNTSREESKETFGEKGFFYFLSNLWLLSFSRNGENIL